MGYTVPHTGIEANYTKEFGCALRVFTFTLDHAVDRERFAHNITCALTGVKGAIGVLKDKLNFMAKGPYPALWQSGDVLPLKDNLSCGRMVEAQDAASHGGLAASALAHKS
jgi:hypothetical protein